MPATAIQQAIITAAEKVLTSNPLKNLSAILMIIAVTSNRTKKESNPRVTILRGILIKKPSVALSMPITRATAIAVP